MQSHSLFNQSFVHFDRCLWIGIEWKFIRYKWCFRKWISSIRWCSFCRAHIYIGLSGELPIFRWTSISSPSPVNTGALDVTKVWCRQSFVNHITSIDASKLFWQECLLHIPCVQHGHFTATWWSLLINAHQNQDSWYSRGFIALLALSVCRCVNFQSRMYEHCTSIEMECF